jgi:hypothetical protein
VTSVQTATEAQASAEVQNEASEQLAVTGVDRQWVLALALLMLAGGVVAVLMQRVRTARGQARH